jgi:DNA-binding LacI/PurR family transcriptional regulator
VRFPLRSLLQTGLLNRFTAFYREPVYPVKTMAIPERKLGGIRAVAALAGVSAATVSLILNEKGSFPATTQTRVLEAARELGYRPHPAARSLAGIRTRVVGLAFSHREAIPFPLTDIDYFARAINGATEEALLRDHSIVVGPPTPQTDVWFRLPLDGVIVFDPVLGDPVPAGLRARSTPMVVVGRDPNGDFDDPCVDIDASSATRIALDHVWELGARRPALATFPLMDAFVADCERTYRDWCDERSIVPVESVPRSSWEQAPRDDLIELLGSARPDAIIALEDILGTESVAAAVELGIEIPTQLKIVAFSDRDSFAGLPLTSVKLDPTRTARAAVGMLIDLIENGELDERSLNIPVQLVRRAST